ncbi:sugar phosphate isomerase/epimerase [Paenibacillus filicis]|uniref:Sugar phosphate isomerase/epimerase n=1 Tax=Paenibacillus gyeongsangnamensis TaxID=3388067 RepID=A0ABT4QBG4_9BACL|nr:sugar phosphate isomerase/epimerase family protein [Paenibacillus filicis]MCZ8514169.1 sugar phosphate isomerase/epimerase [Paenibacillus filicis]
MNLFGWCTDIRNAALLHTLGYDYIETPLAPLQLENREEYKRRLEPLLDSPLPVKAFNIAFPRDIRIVGPEAKEVRIRRYAELAVNTLIRTGSEVLVLGSGGSRNVPEGWERTRAEEQFMQVLSWFATELHGTGIRLAIEPLNKKETNLINSVKEAVDYAKQLNDPSIRVLADFYHMDEEREPLAEIGRYKEWIAHIHLADTDRRHPGSGRYDYDTFVKVVKDSGYEGMISVECRTEQEEEEMGASLDFMKRKWG